MGDFEHLKFLSLVVFAQVSKISLSFFSHGPALCARALGHRAVRDRSRSVGYPSKIALGDFEHLKFLSLFSAMVRHFARERRVIALCEIGRAA